MKILELFYKYLISGPSKSFETSPFSRYVYVFFSHLTPEKMFFFFFVATNGLLFY